MERTLVLLKPDCVQRHLVGEILGRFERKGLKIVGLKMVLADEKLARAHYDSLKERPFFPSLIQFLMSGPTVALVLEGREAVATVRQLMGATDALKAAPGTIRADYAMIVQNNLVHGSDSTENAVKEIALWFRPEELLSWAPADMAWIGEK